MMSRWFEALFAFLTAYLIFDFNYRFGPSFLGAVFFGAVQDEGLVLYGSLKVSEGGSRTETSGRTTGPVPTTSTPLHFTSSVPRSELFTKFLR